MRKTKSSTFVLEVTNGCNWGKCPHCYMNAKTKKDAEFIDLDKINKLINYLYSKVDKPTQILITGGEPLLHPEIVQIIKLIKKGGFTTILVTNCELITEKFIKNTKNYLNQIEITIRGLKNLHDIMMQPHDSELWTSIPKELSLKEQLEWTINHFNSDTHYKRTLHTTELINKFGGEIKIGLNIDAQINTDMFDIVQNIISNDGRVDYINIQIQQISGRAKMYPNVPANLWRHLDSEKLNIYLKQSDKLVKAGMVKQINIIDPINKNIQKELPKNLLKKYYKLEISPALDCFGHIRNNVLFN